MKRLCVISPRADAMTFAVLAHQDIPIRYIAGILKRGRNPLHRIINPGQEPQQGLVDLFRALLLDPVAGPLNHLDKA